MPPRGNIVRFAVDTRGPFGAWAGDPSPKASSSDVDYVVETMEAVAAAGVQCPKYLRSVGPKAFVSDRGKRFMFSESPGRGGPSSEDPQGSQTMQVAHVGPGAPQRLDSCKSEGRLLFAATPVATGAGNAASTPSTESAPAAVEHPSRVCFNAYKKVKDPICRKEQKHRSKDLDPDGARARLGDVSAATPTPSPGARATFAQRLAVFYTGKAKVEHAADRARQVVQWFSDELRATFARQLGWTMTSRSRGMFRSSRASEFSCPWAVVDLYISSTELVADYEDYEALFGITVSLLVSSPLNDTLTAEITLRTREMEERGMLREALFCVKLLLWRTRNQRSSTTKSLLLLCLDLQRGAAGSNSCRVYIAWLLTAGKKGNCWGSPRTEVGREELLARGLSEDEASRALESVGSSPCAGRGLAETWPALFYGARLELEDNNEDAYYSICEFIQERLPDSSKFLAAFVETGTKRSKVIRSASALIGQIGRTSRVPSGPGHWTKDPVAPARVGAGQIGGLMAGLTGGLVGAPCFPYFEVPDAYQLAPGQQGQLQGQAAFASHTPALISPETAYGLQGGGLRSYPAVGFYQPPAWGPAARAGGPGGRGTFFLPRCTISPANLLPSSLLLAYLDVLLLCMPSSVDLLERYVDYMTQAISLQSTYKESIWKLNLYSARIYLANRSFEKAWGAVSFALKNSNCNTQWKCYFLAARMLIESEECRSSPSAARVLQNCSPACGAPEAKPRLERAADSSANAPYPVSQSVALLRTAFSCTSKRFQPTVICELCKHYEYAGRYQEALNIYIEASAQFPGEWKLISEAAMLARKVDSAAALSGRQTAAHGPSYTSRVCGFFLRGGNVSIGRVWAILASAEPDTRRKAVFLARGLKLSPACTELWLEAMRMFLNPLNSCFSVALARECLDKALFYNPQNGDVYVEWQRLSLVQYLLEKKDYSTDFSSSLDKALDSDPSHGRIWGFLTPAQLKTNTMEYQGSVSLARNVLHLARLLAAGGVFKYRALYRAAWTSELASHDPNAAREGRFLDLGELLSLAEVSSAPGAKAGSPTSVTITDDELTVLAAEHPALRGLRTMTSWEVASVLLDAYSPSSLGSSPASGDAAGRDHPARSGRSGRQSPPSSFSDSFSIPTYLFSTAIPFYDYALAMVHVPAVSRSSSARSPGASLRINVPSVRGVSPDSRREDALDLHLHRLGPVGQARRVEYTLCDDLRKRVIFGPDTSI